MKDLFIGFFYVILWVSTPILFGIGIYHSVDKHSVGNTIVSILIPPWGYYMGWESFWHKDNIDWGKRLEKDVMTSFYFLKQDGTSEKFMEINEGMEKFNKKIREYPEEKQEYLRTASTIYIKYSIASYENLLESLDNYLLTGTFNFELNHRTQKLRESLIKYVNKEFVITEDKVLSELKQKLQEFLDSNSAEVNQKYRSNLENYKNNQINIFKDTFKYLFDKDLVLNN